MIKIGKEGTSIMKCPGCGGELRYDIKSRQMLCDSCGRSEDPYRFDTVTKGAESGLLDEGSYQTQVWLCPNCGAQLTYAGETDVTAVCAYCGSANIIPDRLKNEKRPETIIPFGITKEDCKKAYRRALRRAFLSPGYLHKEAQIDSFRGIYMPYWEYEARLDGPVSMEYRGSAKREGDYLYTEIHELTQDIKGSFTGLSHDASTQFDDEISECLEPFPAAAEQTFTPGFLAGFYAETDDDGEKAEDKERTARLIAEEIAAKAAASGMLDPAAGPDSPGKPATGRFAKYKINGESLHIPTGEIRTKRTMFPVWFMSCRNQKGMLYAAVNGATGKVVADFPLSIGRFLALALVIAAGLFTLLNFAEFMGRPMSTFALTAILSSCACWANGHYFAAKKVRDAGSREGSRTFRMLLGFCLLLLAGLGLALLLNAVSNSAIRGLYFLFFIFFFFSSAVRYLGPNGYPKGTPERRFTILSLVAAFASLVFLFFNVRNAIYYYASLVHILLFLIQFSLTVKTHNARAFRRPPQFDKKGGSDHA